MGAGKDVGNDPPAHKGVDIGTQCVMMKALVEQMRESCYYDSSRSTYVPVAVWIMTGFNSVSDDPKNDFWKYCIDNGHVGSWIQNYLG